MRPAALVLMSFGLFAACDDSPRNELVPVTVQWMDWPAEVVAGQEFRTRLVVWGLCAVEPWFHAGASADQSAVTFAPFFTYEREAYCYTRTEAPFVAIVLDTAGTAPGLAADFARSYEMRAAASVYARSENGLQTLPVRTFGSVTVRPSGAAPARRNGAGYVSIEADIEGCVRVRPAGIYAPSAALPLEDQADTVGVSGAFVRGYIYEAIVPVCGETTVFHLVTRE